MVESSDIAIVKSNLDIENNSSSGNFKEYFSFKLLCKLWLWCIITSTESSYYWKTNLTSYLSSERSFICCMQTSKAFKLQHGSCCSMMVTGSFQSFPQPLSTSSVCPTNQPLFVALCTPTVNRLRSSDSDFCHSFNSVHRLDMTYTHLSDRYIHRSPL